MPVRTKTNKPKRRPLVMPNLQKRSMAYKQKGRYVLVGKTPS